MSPKANTPTTPKILRNALYSSPSINVFLTTDSPDYPDAETPLRCVAKIRENPR